MELKPKLLELLKDHASPDEIMDIFSDEYQGVVYPPYDHYKRILLCFAIHFYHVDLVKKLLADDSVDYMLAYEGRDHTPIPPVALVIATSHRFFDIIDLLMAKGARSDAVGLGDFEGDRLVSRGLISAMDIACKNDDVELMQKLRGSYQCSQIPLIHQTIQNGAKECFTVLLNESDMNVYEVDTHGRDLLLSAAPKGLFFIKALAEKGIRDKGQKTFGHLQTSLHLACHLSREGNSKAGNRFVRRDLAECIELLLDMGANAYSLDCSSDLPIDFLSSQILLHIKGTYDKKIPYLYKEHYELLKRCFQFLLENMKKNARKLYIVYPVHHTTYLRLQSQLQTIMMMELCAQTNEQRESVRKCCTVNLDFLEMFLATGVDLQEKISYYGSLMDYFFLHILPLPDIHFASDLFDFVFRNFRMLFNYGGIPARMCYGPLLVLVGRSTQRNSRFLEVCLNALSHTQYWDLISFAINTEYLKKEAKEELTWLLKRQRTLKQLCRVAFYEASPKRNAAVPVNSLANVHEMPEDLKEYILCLRG